jgi:hypothetical protein
MRRLLAHFLLSVALIFQGVGLVCAYGPMPAATVKSAMAMQGMTDAAQACMTSHTCPGCPGDHMTAQTCMQSCSLPASIDRVAFFVPPVLLGDSLAQPPIVSLVDYIQTPPTPPPIA